jgi:hypothetical protein
MTLDMTSRVHYFERQFLRVNEFRDEQLYQLALRRRHNLGPHTWGIVAGLEIALEDGSIVIRAGMAIDGYGRELLLRDKKRMPLVTFDDLGTDRLDVWLVYGRRDKASVPDGYGECGSAAAGGAYRSDEIPQLLFERPLANVVDARQPPGVPTQVLNSPVPATSDDPRDLWRVYLGRVTRTPPTQFSIDLSQRTYVGLVAEVIDHPANATRLEVGKQSSQDQERVIDDVTYVYDQGEANQRSRRFAVFVPEDLVPDEQQTRVELSPRLEILDDGTIRFRGRMVVNGNLRLSAGAVQFVTPAEFTTENPPPKPSIYRIANDTTSDQLRIDLGSDNTINHQFSIGFSDKDGNFTPCLTLALEDQANAGVLAPVVTIHGNLKIEGRIEGDYRPRKLSQEAANAILASFQSGVAAANTP